MAPVSQDCLDDPDNALLLHADADSSRPGKELVAVSASFGVVVLTDGLPRSFLARLDRPLVDCSGSQSDLDAAWAGQVVADAEEEIVVLYTDGGRRASTTTLEIFKRRGREMLPIFTHVLRETEDEDELLHSIEFVRGQLKAQDGEGDSVSAFSWNPQTYAFTLAEEGDVTPPPQESAVPRPLALGADLDAIFQTRCDPNSITMKIETLTAETAELAGMPEGDLGHYECVLKGDIGIATWDMSLAGDAAGGIYSLSVFGDAIKPGNEWSKNHFARLGSEFVRPIVSTAGQRALETLVENYSSKEPQAGTRWTVDHVVINLNQVLAGKHQGKWVIGLSEVAH